MADSDACRQPVSECAERVSYVDHRSGMNFHWLLTCMTYIFLTKCCNVQCDRHLFQLVAGMIVYLHNNDNNMCSVCVCVLQEISEPTLEDPHSNLFNKVGADLHRVLLCGNPTMQWGPLHVCPTYYIYQPILYILHITMPRLCEGEQRFIVWPAWSSCVDRLGIRTGRHLEILITLYITI